MPNTAFGTSSKKRIAIFVLSTFLIVLSACGGNVSKLGIASPTALETMTPTQAPTQTLTQTPTPVPPTPTVGPRPTLPASGVVSFSILHTNDFHIQLLSQNIGEVYAPGAARLAYFIKTYREEVGAQNMLLLDTGDFIEGGFGNAEKYYAKLYNGEAALSLYDNLGYQAVTAGNHEFFYGERRFLEILQEPLSFKFLIANLYKKDDADVCTQEPVTTPYQIYDLGQEGGTKVRVAVIGVTLSNMATGGVFLEHVCTIDAVDAIARYYDEIKNQEFADVIVVLSHNGNKTDLEIAQRLIDDGMPVDIIIGGHSHTFIEEPQLVGQTNVVQAGELGRQVGVFNLTYDRTARSLDVKWTPHTIDAQTPEDSATVDFIQAVLP